MHTSEAKRRLKAILRTTFCDHPYRHINDFVHDVAALIRTCTTLQGRKARGSLKHTTSPPELEYLLNLHRFTARHPDVATPYGTTTCEAWHRDLNSHFTAVTQQTRQHLQLHIRTTRSGSSR